MTKDFISQKSTEELPGCFKVKPGYPFQNITRIAAIPGYTLKITVKIPFMLTGSKVITCYKIKAKANI
jgi:hypothetical protein